MADPTRAEADFNSITNRLLRREALRPAAAELNTTSGAGLEGVLARVSAEVTADALARVDTAAADTKKDAHGTR